MYFECEYLRTEGYTQYNAFEFEERLRDFIVDNCYTVRGFGKDTESNNLAGSVNFTKKLISEGKISNVAINGATYLLKSGNSTYMGLNLYGATPNDTTATRQQTYSAPRQAPRQTQAQSTNTYNSRQAPRATQNSYSNANNLLLVRIRGVLSVLILLAFIINIARVVFTSFALSNPQFWALPIGLIVTREVLFRPNRDFNLLGRILITAVAWISVAAFL